MRRDLQLSAKFNSLVPKIGRNCHFLNPYILNLCGCQDSRICHPKEISSLNVKYVFG
jgi:hypothetical protein